MGLAFDCKQNYNRQRQVRKTPFLDRCYLHIMIYIWCLSIIETIMFQGHFFPFFGEIILHLLLQLRGFLHHSGGMLCFTVMLRRRGNLETKQTAMLNLKNSLQVSDEASITELYRSSSYKVPFLMPPHCPPTGPHSSLRQIKYDFCNQG